jgi:8-oxo-dGTP pyrophosphatase MutT (NUDIX family)
MKKVDKAMMFVYRSGKPDMFFVVHREKRNDYVVPTGHVESGETTEEAAWREVEEELGVKPLDVLPTGYKVISVLENGKKQSSESAFIVKIPDQEVQFLEESDDGTSDGVGSWVSRQDLVRLLTYPGQRNAVESLFN